MKEERIGSSKKLLLPQNKFDFDSCKKIQNLNDNDFLKVVRELLTWLQDANWPIFPEVIKIVTEKQNIAVEHICEIFTTNNEIWQYWVLTELYPNLSNKNKTFMRKNLELCLEKLLNKPKLNEDESDLAKILDTILR